jgi:hypothetical protein
MTRIPYHPEIIHLWMPNTHPYVLCVCKHNVNPVINRGTFVSCMGNDRRWWQIYTGAVIDLSRLKMQSNPPRVGWFCLFCEKGLQIRFDSVKMQRATRGDVEKLYFGMMDEMVDDFINRLVSMRIWYEKSTTIPSVEYYLVPLNIFDRP